jgi:hypothetical protein
MLANQLDGSIHVLAGLGMKTDIARPGGREVRHDAIHRAHHQVHIDRHRYAAVLQSGAHHRPHSQIGHIVIVHHVEVDQIGAGGDHRIDFLAKARKVG